MSERSNHKFQFSAAVLAQAAAEEARYHEDRIHHWTKRRDAALRTVEETIHAKVVKHEVTNGYDWSIDIDYGNKDSWNEFRLASSKVDSHRRAADEFRSEEQVYSTQGDRAYELDTADVTHFRLGGKGRPE